MWGFDRYCNECAIIDDDSRSVTYADIAEFVDIFHDVVGDRCLIFVLCKNSIGSVLGYVSSIENHCVALLLNSELDNDLLKSLLEKYHPKYIWAPDGSAAIAGKNIALSKYDYSLCKTDYDTGYEINPELALLLTTSGSTGSPKFVRLSYENLESNTRSIVQYLKITSDERPITTLPMNYTYGLSIINTHLMAGATLLVTDKGLMQKDFWSFFKEEGATSFGGVPYTYEMLNRLRFERMDLPSLRTMTQAGGKLSVELQKKFTAISEDKGYDFVIMYGQCEATARMAYLPPENSKTHPGSIGIAIPGGQFKIIDENNKEILAPYTPGELIYVGKNVSLGYAECKEDLAKGDERNGVLFTGDVAQRDDDGYYYIVGRMKRFLKVFGNRVNLDDLEQMVKNEYVGIDVAISGRDDLVYIFLTNPEHKEDVKKYLSNKTGLNHTAFKVVIIDSIPKNDSGKILYTALSDYFT